LFGILLGTTGILLTGNFGKFAYIYKDISRTTVPFFSKVFLGSYMVYNIFKFPDSSIGFYKKIRGTDSHYVKVLDEQGTEHYLFFSNVETSSQTENIWYAHLKVDSKLYKEFRTSKIDITPLPGNPVVDLFPLGVSKYEMVSTKGEKVETIFYESFGEISFDIVDDGEPMD
jgi:hypothetical protein